MKHKKSSKPEPKKQEEAAQSAPPAVPEVSGIYKAMCIAQARNPQWIYVRVSGIDGKIPVVIPRRLSGKLEGKWVYIEAISDSTGTSYRYVNPPE